MRKKIGTCLGKLFINVVRHRKAVVKINLKIAFPTYSQAQYQALYEKCVTSLGLGVIETTMAWFWKDEKLKAISYLDADADALAKIRDKKTPVILIGSHSTLLELGVRLLGLYVDSAGVYRPMKLKSFERWITQQRGRAATSLIHYKDMRTILQVLKNGENLWYALDQDMGLRVSVFAPFFGKDACSVNILPKLTAKTGASWIPVFIWREDDKQSYVVKILPEIDAENKDDVAVMTAVNKVYEQEILQHPEQYYWIHRRFKNDPNGRTSTYPER